MKSKTARYIYNILIFIAIVLVLDYFIGSQLKKQYSARSRGLLYRTSFSIDSTKADLLIFGSSRANHHYVPTIFEDSLQMSCYNTGRDGCLIIYQLAVIKCVVARYSPKVIILDIVPFDFMDMYDNYDKLNCLLPYYKTHPVIKSIIKTYRNFEDVKMLSSIYPYNHCIFFLGRNRQSDYAVELKDKGFLNTSNEWKQSKITEKESKKPFVCNSTKIAAYKEFIDICKKNNIKLFVAISPFFQNLNSRSNKIIKVLEDVALENNVDFFDYSNDTACTNYAHLFYNVNHLNTKGANIYSRKLAGKVGEQLKSLEYTLTNNK